MTHTATYLQTPSALKWLLSERAALEGALIKSQKSIDILRERIATQQAALARHETSARSCRERVDAMDVTVGLLHPEVGSSRPAPVFTWQGKYGPRGNLSVFILEKLREASPEAIVTSVLCAEAIQKFGLDTSTPLLRRRVRKSVGQILSNFARRGLVERLPASLPKSGAGIWRLRQNSPLTEMLALAHVQESGHDPPEDPAGGQMGRQ